MKESGQQSAKMIRAAALNIRTKLQQTATVNDSWSPPPNVCIAVSAGQTNKTYLGNVNVASGHDNRLRAQRTLPADEQNNHIDSDVTCTAGRPRLNQELLHECKMKSELT